MNVKATPTFVGLLPVCVAAAFAFPSFKAARADETIFGSCGTEITAPEAVVTALDEILVRTVAPPPELRTVFGAAPGAVLSVKTKGWIYVRSVGVSDVATKAVMDCDMPFQIGSNTKMMTAVVLLQLVEEGGLNLDDPLSKHLPEIATELPYGDQIILRHLATHTSGVFNYTDDAPDGTPGIMTAGLTDPTARRRGYQPRELLDFVIANGKPAFRPGAEGAWQYSNTGYILLGLVIEKLEGRAIGESFQSRIFDPLGMADTYLWNDVPSDELGLPSSYYAYPFTSETTDWNMSQAWTAGAVISTANDMHRFMEAVVSGTVFKSRDTLALMMSTVKTPMPQMPGYGIGLGEKEPGVWGHGGQTLGFQSDVASFVEQDISVVGWANSAQNAMGFGVPSIASTLRETGVIADLKVNSENP